MHPDLKNLNQRHKLMMHRLMAGEKATDIAQDMHMSDRTFSIIRNSPLFKAEMDRLTRVARYTLIKTSQEVAEIINSAAPQAARRMVDFIDHENEHIAMKASEKVIDYSDFGAAKAAEANKPIFITQQQMVLIEEGMVE